MALTNKGVELIIDALLGDTFTPFNNANAHLANGTSTTAFAKTQTDLQTPTSPRKPMDVGFPTQTAVTITMQATWGTAENNVAWDEWGVFDALTGGNMLSRKVEALGTKTSAEAWQLTVTLTIGNP